MGSGGGSGGGADNPYYSMGQTPSDGSGGVKGFLGKYGGLLAGGVGGLGLGGASRQQPQASPAMNYNAPMMPYVPPPQATNSWGGPHGPMDAQTDQLRGMPSNPFYGG